MARGLDHARLSALSAQFRTVPNTGYFLAHFTSRAGYIRGATLEDPLALAHCLHVTDANFAAIVTLLVAQDIIVSNANGSVTLTRRGEEWYGDDQLLYQEMLRDIDAPRWYECIAGIHDVQEFAEQTVQLNEHHGTILLEFAQRMTAEVVRDCAPEKICLGLMAAALAVTVANDGTRPEWIPSYADIHETIVALVDAAKRLGLDASHEVRSVTERVSGQARVMLRDYIRT